MSHDDLDSRVSTARKTGTERFHADGELLPFDLLGFWQWSSSDLVSNALRGTLAEFLVACDLNVSDGVRAQWDAYDLRIKDGVKVEVKSAAYVQSWAQSKLSQISFDIRPTIGWDAETNKTSTERKRQSDVYVFALLKHKDKATIDPMEVQQWGFYVLPTEVLNDKLTDQRQICLSKLLELNPTCVAFGHVADVIGSIFQPLPGKPA